MRILLAIVSTCVLAACSTTPPQSGPPPQARGEPAPSGASSQRPRVSPYAPAQEDPSKRGDYVAGGLYAPHIRDTAPDYIPDVDAIPEPEVVDEPRSRYGNRSPYQVLGRNYHVLESPEGLVERGIASYYGNKFHGRRTSNQEVYDMYAFTAAHKHLPLPSFARVTNLANGRSVVVRVNDRGPFHEGRVIDLSWAAAVKLDMHMDGTAQVEVVGLSPGENARHHYDAIASAPAAAAPAEAAAAEATGMDQLIEVLPAQAVATTAAPAIDPDDRRFNMLQDGRVMTADDFDAWLAERGIDLRSESAAAQAATSATVAAAADRAVEAAAVAAPASADSVVLQVGAFGARANAERALATLRDAGLSGLQLLDDVSSGRQIWRLRLGPVDLNRVAELSAQVAGLGLGQPHVVRD